MFLLRLIAMLTLLFIYWALHNCTLETQVFNGPAIIIIISLELYYLSLWLRFSLSWKSFCSYSMSLWLCNVHCALCVHCTRYSVHCTAKTVQFVHMTEQCIPCTVHCALCTAHCALCTVHCKLCTVHCTAKTVQFISPCELKAHVSYQYNLSVCRMSQKSFSFSKIVYNILLERLLGHSYLVKVLDRMNELINSTCMWIIV